MKILDVRNLAYTETGAIDCEVLVGEQWLPFCASEDDSMAYGAMLYQEAIGGKWGEVKPYEPTEKAYSEPVSGVTTKSRLMTNAEAVIAPLSRAVKYDIATDEEKAALEAWERYTVLLSRVDVDNPVWPDEPDLG
ncbi:tail fiber assembly protein [Enterobacter hormaechei]|nr:tail fiber assembly protein [Enterobacter hormaechei]